MKDGKQVKQSEVPKMKKAMFLSKLAMAFVMLCFSLGVYAQSGDKIRVTGTITDDTGEVLIGASVAEKGTTNATITGIDGGYAISVPANSTLVVSYIGYTPKEILVNGQSKIDIIISEDTQLLDEVVVTALGIKRDKKALGYSMQEVKGEGMTETRDPNIANALSGKVAGLQIKQSGTGLAGSSRIVLRGNNSISGNNQPLVVVDGVPLDNTTGGSDDYWGNQNVDRGSGLSDVSPEDIESVSVLKGPAAAALYGSRAGNGVIMITTKKGTLGKGLGIVLNSNLTFESPMMTPDFQNVYGQGTDGAFNSTSVASWGGKMDGSQVADYTTSAVNPKSTYATRPYEARDNDLYKDFLRTGTTWTNSIDLSAGGDNSTFRASLMNMQNKGVVPNSGIDKTSFTLRSTGKWGKLSADAKITFVTQKTENRTKLAADPDNIFYNYLVMPRSVSFSDLGNQNLFPDYAFPEGSIHGGSDLSGSPASWTPTYDGKIRNPYWGAYKNTNTDRKNRYYGFFSLKYDFTDWLNLQVRSGLDMYNSKYTSTQATKTPYWKTEGDYFLVHENFYESNTDFLLTFNKNLTEKIGLVASAGGNMRYGRTDYLRGDAGGIFIPGFYQTINGKDQRATERVVKSQTNSLYGTVSFAYDNYLYVDVTGRNDWSSTLNKDNRSFFYPSVGVSAVITEFLHRKGVDTGILNYAKVRTSWAEVGNSIDPYKLLTYVDMRVESVYDPNTESIVSVLTGQKNPVKPLYDIKPEKIQSWELGFEAKAFNNRLGVDFTYYNKDAKNQILTVQAPPASGYSSMYANAGVVNNKGIELVLYGTPVQTKDFSWDVSLNFSNNKTKIKSLTEDTKEQILGSSNASFIRIVAREGGGFGDLYGTTIKRDDSGRVMVDENGLPIVDSEFSYLGNYNPDWMGGITNTFNYKGISLSFLIDMRKGGKVYMGSLQQGMNAGTLEGSLNGREGMVVEGVKADGSANNIETKAQYYYGRLAGITEPWIYDATNIRLRELSIGYSLPRKVLAKTPFYGVKLSFVGRNLWMIHSKAEGFDPEAGYTTSNAQGIEFASMPTQRSLGFNLNVTF